jgi:ribonuclease HI
VWIDGGTHKNRICLVDGDKVIVKIRDGNYTNNELEYLALQYGLTYVNNNYSKKKITIYSDSMLIVNQINGKWRVTTPTLVPLHAKCAKLLKSNIKIIWISRKFNHAGWVLEDMIKSKT